MDKRASTTPDVRDGVDPRHENDPVYSNEAAISAQTSKYQIAGGPEGLGELIGGIIKDLQDLVRDEIQLAKVELREDASTIAKALAMVAGAAMVGLVGFIFLMLAVTYALAEAMDAWLAAGIVAVSLLVIAAILAMVAKKKLSAANLKPEQTIESLKEDKAWAQEQVEDIKEEKEWAKQQMNSVKK